MAVIAMIALSTIFFTALKILQYRALFSWENGDDAVYNQCAYSTARGGLFQSTVKGDRIMFDHLHPIIAVYGGAYLAHPHIYTWFLLNSFLLSAGAVPIFRLARGWLGSSGMALAAAGFYLFYSPLHAMQLGVLEPEKLAIPFWLFAAQAYYRKRPAAFAAWSAAALCCKENMGLILCMFGVYALLQGRRAGWILIPFAAGLVWLAVALGWVVPKLMPEVTYQYEYLRQIQGGGGGFSGIFDMVLLHPWEALRLAVRTDHLLLLWRLARPTALLCLLAPEVLLLSAPTLAQILLTQPRLTTPQDHWLSGAVPFFILATVIGWSRLGRVAAVGRRRARWAAPIMLLACAIWSAAGDNLIGELHDDHIDDTRFIGVTNIFDPAFLRWDNTDRAAWEIMAFIPDSASVAANGPLLVPLSNRLLLYEFGHPRHEGRELTADYIMLQVSPAYFGGGHDVFLDTANLLPLKTRLEAGMYDVKAFRDGFLLLRSRPAPASDGPPAALLRTLDRVMAQSALLAPLRGSRETF
ncbi:DUF2079 domain-containing protein [bacterium]|nr:DUF2079 domain-containing protein [candidate division CSSED10-310 bacterium]